MPSYDRNGNVIRRTQADTKKLVIYGLVAFAVFVLLCVGGAAGCKSYNRYQARADRANAVKVTEIEVKRAAQQARINRAQIEATKAEAQKRIEEAKGIRAAQDLINETLTPLYVQHEAIQKLPQARAIYVPSGPQGIPQVMDMTRNQP
jgi:hypothetical protein